MGRKDALYVANGDGPSFGTVANNSTLFWNDTRVAEMTLPVKIQGRPHLISTDALGALGINTPRPANVCNSGKPGHGFARIIDLADEKHPKTVSKLMLEVADPANCSKVMHDPTAFVGYSSFACDVDDDENAKLLACSYVEGGLRVFDIRDPAHPREIAYYKPPAGRTESRPGSPYDPAQPTWGIEDHTADPVIVPRFLKRGKEIAFTSIDNGFQVVRFADRFKASHQDLFRN